MIQNIKIKEKEDQNCNDHFVFIVLTPSLKLQNLPQINW